MLTVTDDEIKIVDSCRKGPFTIVEATYADNDRAVFGWGIARKGYLDHFIQDRGLHIATARAKKAIVKKLTGKVINNQFMG